LSAFNQNFYLAKQLPVKIPRIKLYNIRPAFLEYGGTDGERRRWKMVLVGAQGAREDA